jgi:hypothetical protein
MTTNRDGCTLCPGAMCDLCGSGYCVTHNVGSRHVCAFCRHNVPLELTRDLEMIDAFEFFATVIGKTLPDAMIEMAKLAPTIVAEANRLCRITLFGKTYRWSETETRPDDGKKVIRVSGVEVGAYVREDESDHD